MKTRKEGTREKRCETIDGDGAAEVDTDGAAEVDADGAAESDARRQCS
jgi:hypothetical protein